MQERKTILKRIQEENDRVIIVDEQEYLDLELEYKECKKIAEMQRYKDSDNTLLPKAVKLLFEVDEKKIITQVLTKYALLHLKISIFHARLMHVNTTGLNNSSQRELLSSPLVQFGKYNKNKTLSYFRDIEFQNEFEYALNTYKSLLEVEMAPFKLLDTSIRAIDGFDLYKIAILFSNGLPPSLLKLRMYYNYYFSPDNWQINYASEDKNDLIDRFTRTYQDLLTEYTTLAKQKKLTLEKKLEQFQVNGYAHKIDMQIHGALENQKNITPEKKLSFLNIQLHLFKKYLLPDLISITQLKNTNFKGIANRDYSKQIVIYIFGVFSQLESELQQLQSDCKNQAKLYRQAQDNLKLLIPIQTQIKKAKEVLQAINPDILMVPAQPAIGIEFLENQILIFHEEYHRYRNQFEVCPNSSYVKIDSEIILKLQDEIYENAKGLLKKLYQLKTHFMSESLLRGIFLELSGNIIALIIDIIRIKIEAYINLFASKKAMLEDEKSRFINIDAEMELYRTLALKEFVDIYHAGMEFLDDNDYLNNFLDVIIYKITLYETYKKNNNIRAVTKKMYFNIDDDLQTILCFLKQPKPYSQKLTLLNNLHNKKKLSWNMVYEDANPFIIDFWFTYSHVQSKYEKFSITIASKLEMIRANIQAFVVKYFTNVGISETTLHSGEKSRKVIYIENCEDRAREISSIFREFIFVNYPIFESIPIHDIKTYNLKIEFENLLELVIGKLTFMIRLISATIMMDKKRRFGCDDLEALNKDVNVFITNMLALYKNQYLSVFPANEYKSNFTIVEDIQKHLKQYGSGLIVKKRRKKNAKIKHQTQNEINLNSEVVAAPKRVDKPTKSIQFDSSKEAQRQNKDIPEKSIKKAILAEEPHFSEPLALTVQSETGKIMEAILADRQALLEQRHPEIQQLFDLIERAYKTDNFLFFCGIVDQVLPLIANKLTHKVNFLMHCLNEFKPKHDYFSYFNKKIKGILFGKKTTPKEEIATFNEELGKYKSCKKLFDDMFYQHISGAPPKLRDGLLLSNETITNHNNQLILQVDKWYRYSDELDRSLAMEWDEYRISIGYEDATKKGIQLTREQALIRGQQILIQIRRERTHEFSKTFPHSQLTEHRKSIHTTFSQAKQAKELIDTKKKPEDFLPLLQNGKAVIQMVIPDDINSRFIYLADKKLENIEFGGSRTVLTLINRLLDYPVRIRGDYDFTCTSNKATLKSAGFIQSRHVHNLYHSPLKTMRMDLYVPGKNDLPDIHIAGLKILPDGIIRDITGEGLVDLCSLVIRCFGDANERILHDPVIALRIIKYKCLLSIYGFSIETETEKAVFNFRLALKDHKNHLLSVIQKELSVFGETYIQELMHYGLLEKLFGIEKNTGIQETLKRLDHEFKKLSKKPVNKHQFFLELLHDKESTMDDTVIKAASIPGDPFS